MSIKHCVALASTTAATGLAATLPDTGQMAQAATIRPQAHHQVATRVTTANLPVAADIVVPGSRPVIAATIRGHWDDGHDALCRTHTWADLGSNAEITRDFRTKPDARTDQFAEASIASFGSHAAAVRAAERMAGSLDCAGVQERVDYVYGSATTVRRTVTLPSGQRLHLVLFTYRSTRAPRMLVTDSIGVTVVGTHTELVEVESLVAPGRQGLRPITLTMQKSLPALRR